MFAIALLLAAGPAPLRPALPTGPQLIFANGDRVPGTVRGGDENTLLFAADLGGTTEPWTVPLPQVKFLWLTDPPPEFPVNPDRYPNLPAGRKQDLLLLRSGDSRPGAVQRFTAAGVEISPGGPVPFSALDGFAPNPALVAPRRLKGEAVRLVTTTGARITVIGYKAEGDRMTAVTAFGAKLDLPKDSVAAADPLVGIKYLSDLEPKVETRSFLSIAPEWMRDATSSGKSLTVRTENGFDTYDRGLGLRPATKLSFAVPLKSKSFTAIVGRDPAELGRGGAVVRILADGKDITPDAARNPAAIATAVELGIAGVKTLTLDVAFGAAGELPATVLWADAKFRE